MAEPIEGLWLSLADLARERGVSRQSIAERVGRLAKIGKVETRPGKGRSILVNVAQFDRAAAETVDEQRALNGRGDSRAAAPTIPGDPVLSREQARRAAYQADNAALDLAERLKQLAPVNEVRDGATASVAVMRSAYALAIDDTANAIAHACGCEAVLVRPHLRKLERTALGAFVKGIRDLIRKIEPAEMSREA